MQKNYVLDGNEPERYLTVKLKGIMSEVFPSEFRCYARSIPEALSALFVNFPSFQSFLADAESNGIIFRVKAGSQEISEEECSFALNKKIRNITIEALPAGAGGVLKAAAGIALLGLGIAGVAFLGFSAAQIAITGAALLFGGISQIFTKKKSTRSRETDNEQLRSHLFDRPFNQQAEGARLGIVYGKVMIPLNIVLSQQINTSYFAT